MLRSPVEIQASFPRVLLMDRAGGSWLVLRHPRAAAGAAGGPWGWRPLGERSQARVEPRQVQRMLLECLECLLLLEYATGKSHGCLSPYAVLAQVLEDQAANASPTAYSLQHFGFGESLREARMRHRPGLAGEVGDAGRSQGALQAIYL